MKQYKLLIIGILGIVLAVTFFWFQDKFFTKNDQLTSLQVSAAISLQEPLQELKLIYEQNHPQIKIIYNFAASGTLQQQIQQGAGVDIFISAATKSMDMLATKGLIVANSRKNLVKNQLALITAKNGVNIQNFADLSKSNIQTIALGETKTVPVGEYAQQVLQKLGLFESLKSKLVYANNAKQVLIFVETGNADCGITYLSDAQSSSHVKIITIASESLHSPILYPMAVIKDSKHPIIAQDFVNFLSQNEAKQVFKNFHFQPL